MDAEMAESSVCSCAVSGEIAGGMVNLKSHASVGDQYEVKAAAIWIADE
jgi:hypothetical protein